MPNYVDVSRTAELFGTVSDNYVVLALLCAFFGLYLVTLLWAGYADRRSRSKVNHHGQQPVNHHESKTVKSRWKSISQPQQRDS